MPTFLSFALVRQFFCDNKINNFSLQEMADIHFQFHDELRNACYKIGRKPPTLLEVFTKYKKKFVLYGDYCSNLPKAQECIEELMKKNEVVREKIEVGVIFKS